MNNFIDYSQYGSSTIELAKEIMRWTIEYFEKGSAAKFFTSTSDLTRMNEQQASTAISLSEVLAEMAEKAGVEPIVLK